MYSVCSVVMSVELSKKKVLVGSSTDSTDFHGSDPCQSVAPVMIRVRLFIFSIVDNS